MSTTKTIFRKLKYFNMMEKKETDTKRGILVFSGLIMMIFPVMCAFTGAVGFLFKIAITVFHFPSAFILAVVTALFFYKPRRLDIIYAIVLAAAVVLICLALSGFHRAVRWDERAYHHPAAIAMAQGWNPVWQPEVAKWNPQEWGKGGYAGMFYLESFPKGQWIIVAVTYKFFGRIEAGNFDHLLYLILSIPIAALAFMRFPRCSPCLAWLAGIAAGLNPIAIEQYQTGYIDGLLASLLTIFIFSLIAFILSGKKFFLLFTVTSFAFLVNLKLTAPVIGGIIAAGFLLIIFLFKRDQYPAYLKVMAGASILALIIGVNPYLTNTIKFGSPLYPIFPDTADGLKNMRALKIMHMDDKNRVYQFFAAQIFSDCIAGRRPPVYAGPDRFNFKNTAVGAQEICGFGPLFGIAFLVSVAGIPFITRERLQAAILITIYISFLIIPHQAIARYIPTAWIIPVYTLFILATIKDRIEFSKIIGIFFLTVLTVNSIIIFYEAAFFNLKASYNLHKSLLNSFNRGCVRYAVKYIDKSVSFLSCKKYEEQSIKDFLSTEIVPYDEKHKAAFSLVHKQYVRQIYGAPVSHSPLTILEFFKKYDHSIIFILAQDDASRSLSHEIKKYISEAGGSIDLLKFRQGYAAILKNRKIVREVFGKPNEAQLHYADNSLPSFCSGISLTSRGYDGKIYPESILSIRGKKILLKKRGLHLIAIDGQYVVMACFDTHKYDNQRIVPKIENINLNYSPSLIAIIRFAWFGIN